MAITRPPTAGDRSLHSGSDGQSHADAHNETADALEQMVFNVKSYGAVGDDATDNTTAIQAALDAAAAIAVSTVGGGRVYVPPGCFRISNVKIAKGVSLIGSGMGSSELRSIPSNGTSELGLITLKNPTTDTDVEIRDLSIHGLSSSQTLPIHGIHFDQTGAGTGDKRHRVTNVWIQNCKGSGIHFGQKASACRVRGVRIQTCDLHGYHVEGANSYDQIVSDTEIINSGLHGVFMQDTTSNASFFSGVQSANSGRLDAVNYGDGFRFESTNNNAQGCESNNNLRDGVSITLGQNNWTGVIRGNAGFLVRLGASAVDCGIVAGLETGINTSTGLVTLSAATRNSVVFTNFIDAAISGAPVQGSPQGSFVQVGPERGQQSITYAASITPDPYRGEEKQLTAMTGGITVNATTRQHSGQRMQFMFLQDGTGGRTITFNAQYLTNWTPALAINKTDMIKFFWRSSDSKWVQTAVATGI